MDNPRLIALTDAAHGGSDAIYGQTGGLCGILMNMTGCDGRIFHAISWTSHKQKRVSYAVFGAEMLAAADADDRGYDLKLSLISFLRNPRLKHEIFVDERALFDTITTLHDPREFRLRKTVARMRDSFQCGELDCATWIDGKSNLADALIKDNPTLSPKLNSMLACGLWDVKLDDRWGLS